MTFIIVWLGLCGVLALLATVPLWLDIAVVAFLRSYGLDKDFKLNVETNHATLAGHTMMHELAYASMQGLLGSIDANRGDLLLPSIHVAEQLRQIVLWHIFHVHVLHIPESRIKDRRLHRKDWHRQGRSNNSTDCKCSYSPSHSPRFSYEPMLPFEPY